MGLASENPRISKGFFQTGPRPAAGSSAAAEVNHPMTGNQGFFFNLELALYRGAP
jgi:hypothetical protein